MTAGCPSAWPWRRPPRTATRRGSTRSPPRRPSIELLERRAEAGIAGLRATRWCDLHPRLGERAPYDRSGWLLRSGLIRLDGSERPALDVYTHAARAGLEAAEPRPWPERLDVDAYYANLPDSLLDVVAGWRREHDDEPAILDRSET